MNTYVSFPLLLLLLTVAVNIRAEFLVSTNDLRILLNSKKQFSLFRRDKLENDVDIFFTIKHGLVSTEPDNFTFTKDESNRTIEVLGLKPGSSVINTNSTTLQDSELSKAFVRVIVERSNIIHQISEIVGWIYFFAWSISFYPQIYSNYKRKSVVGLNFDFLSLNIVGFIMYSLFNCGLYWIPEIEQEYFNRHPRGLNPVQINDVFFGIHAVFATIVTIIQCFIYETGSQKVSTVARIIHGIFVIFTLASMIMSLLNIITWLDFLYGCSYVKLTITLIKYIPQAIYNYQRKSTIGWSIGNIFLDFTGGILSMLQMILNSHNHDDWASIFGDPTKFGLGFFSVSFDVLFLVQHYVLYRDVNSKVIDLKGRV